MAAKICSESKLLFFEATAPAVKGLVNFGEMLIGDVSINLSGGN